MFENLSAGEAPDAPIPPPLAPSRIDLPSLPLMEAILYALQIRNQGTDKESRWSITAGLPAFRPCAASSVGWMPRQEVDLVHTVDACGE